MSKISIERINSNFEDVINVIKESYLTVAKEFGITKENGVTNPAFMKVEHFEEMYNKGIELYGAFIDSTCIGFVGLEDAKNGLFYLEKLAVKPEYRHNGYGLQLMDFVFNRVKLIGGKEISIGIINENKVLKNWYLDYGFKETEIKNYEHLPFTVCLLRKDV